MSPEEIQTVLADHALWLTDTATGKLARGKNARGEPARGGPTWSENAMSETDILTIAAQALAEREALRKAIIASDERLRLLCRQYEDATGVRGFAPYHLAQSCRARGIAA